MITLFLTPSYQFYEARWMATSHRIVQPVPHPVIECSWLQPHANLCINEVRAFQLAQS